MSNAELKREIAAQSIVIDIAAMLANEKAPLEIAAEAVKAIRSSDEGAEQIAWSLASLVVSARDQKELAILQMMEIESLKRERRLCEMLFGFSVIRKALKKLAA